MHEIIRHHIYAPALAVLLIGATVGASEVRAQAPTIDEEAVALLKRSAEFISRASRFQVIAEIGFDVVQDSGRKIEFGGRRQSTVRRPDRLRVDFTPRVGPSGSVFFNGQDLTVHIGSDNIYAQVARPGGIDQAVHYLSDTLDVPMPLSDFFVGDSAEVLTEGIEAAYYVDEATIAGVPTDHLAFSNDEVDFQIWIAQRDEPLPQRVVITYKLALGHPQFWAQFLKWDLSPEAPDSLFEFEPPEGAERLPFMGMIAPSELKGDGQ